MRTAPPRREDGKFGIDSAENSTDGEGVRKKGFQPGHKKVGGRKPGSPNKLTVEAAQLPEIPGLPERPRDPLLCLEWVQMHPKASLMMISDAAYKRAKFMYATKGETKIDLGPKSEEVARLLVAGRERVAKMERPVLP